ncbi:hypothetical protein XacyCFBP2565_06990 [Xanthomonas arboricola pv. corylina]|uniref:type II toxin-antitoxin system YhaV family toxin n=1 Tax=Xanthomonas arboricola TaxID=56448 RepID=UPI000CEEFC61|nr:type II toxin-antitoxin system YhaV family toxin [Xanthomonas arboricola]PPU15563.1 hypothetical protein XacyCFBP2565_06990 [Xanthomonas arboricola pv. corylina]
MTQDELTEINGWALYSFDLFADRLSGLLEEAKRVRAADPDGYRSHPVVKLVVCVNKAIRQVVPSNPMHNDFLQGNTLGKDLRHWRRVKKQLPERYRLFFQFRSNAPQTVIYAWLNDEFTLRKECAKSDCYTVFKAMVENGTVPNSYESLRSASKALQSAS